MIFYRMIASVQNENTGESHIAQIYRHEINAIHQAAIEINEFLNRIEHIGLDEEWSEWEGTLKNSKFCFNGKCKEGLFWLTVMVLEESFMDDEGSKEIEESI